MNFENWIKYKLLIRLIPSNWTLLSLDFINLNLNLKWLFITSIKLSEYEELGNQLKNWAISFRIRYGL